MRVLRPTHYKHNPPMKPANYLILATALSLFSSVAAVSGADHAEWPDPRSGRGRLAAQFHLIPAIFASSSRLGRRSAFSMARQAAATFIALSSARASPLGLQRLQARK